MTDRVDVKPVVRHTVIAETSALYSGGWVPAWRFEDVHGDASRVVVRILDWRGGQGRKPPVGFLTAAGSLTQNAAEAAPVPWTVPYPQWHLRRHESERGVGFVVEIVSWATVPRDGPPVGYIKRDGTLTMDEAEAEIVSL